MMTIKPIHSAATLLAALVLSACERTPSEPTYDGPPFDSLVVTLSSTVAVGRTVHPTLALLHKSFSTTYEELAEIPVATRLESSNPGVLSVAADGTMHANATGTASITARLAGHETTLLVNVTPGLVVTYVDGTDGLEIAGVNDGGDVIGRTAAGGRVLVRAGAITDLGPCLPNAINNAGQIACTVLRVPSGAAPGLYAAGTITTPLDTASGQGTGITESGALFGLLYNVGGASRVFVWTPAGVTYRTTSTMPGSTYTVNTALNGIVTNVELYPKSSIVRASGTTGLQSGPGGRWSQARDINDADDAVGTGEVLATGSGDVGGSAAIWRAANGWSTENPSYRATNATAISEGGHVVGTGRDGVYVWHGGRYTILADALADAGWTLTSTPSISRSGKVAAVGQHTSGKRGVVLIDVAALP